MFPYRPVTNPQGACLRARANCAKVYNKVSAPGPGLPFFRFCITNGAGSRVTSNVRRESASRRSPLFNGFAAPKRLQDPAHLSSGFAQQTGPGAGQLRTSEGSLPADAVHCSMVLLPRSGSRTRPIFLPVLRSKRGRELGNCERPKGVCLRTQSAEGSMPADAADCAKACNKVSAPGPGPTNFPPCTTLGAGSWSTTNIRREFASRRSLVTRCFRRFL